MMGWAANLKKKQYGVPGTVMDLNKQPSSGVSATGMAHQQPVKSFGMPGGISNMSLAASVAAKVKEYRPQQPAGYAAPTPAPAAPNQFSYDPNTDPVYQKALTQAKVNAQGASGDAMASLNKRGILDSTITSDRVAGIQQDAISNVETNLMPQLAQQAFQRYQDAENQKNQADQLAIQQGQLTGFYESPEMKGLYNDVLQAKQDWANAKTPEEKAAAHQRAEDARGKLTGLNANAGLAGSDVTLDQARGNQAHFGVQTMDAQRMAYDQSADNPANQAQIISNKIDQLKLNNMPETMKLELEQLKQQVAAGKIDAKTAEYNLNELTNPKSVTNQSKALQLQLDKMAVSNKSTQNKLEVQKLQKQIANIGKTPPQSDYEAQMNQVKLDTAKEKLKQLQEGKPSSDSPKTPTYTDVYKDIDNSLFIQKGIDANGQPTGKYAVNDPVGLADYIFSQNLSEADTKKLFQRYGLKWGG